MVETLPSGRVIFNYACGKLTCVGEMKDLFPTTFQVLGLFYGTISNLLLLRDSEI